MAAKKKSGKKPINRRTKRVVPTSLPHNPETLHPNYDRKSLPRTMFPNLSLQDVLAPTGTKTRKKHEWRSEETKARQLAGLRPVKPGEVRYSGPRKRRRPFHEAAQLIASSNLEELSINPDDTVAQAIVKRLGHKALMMADVPAAKEFADRAEGTPQVVRTDGDAGESQINTGIGEILVRFGVQLSINPANES